MGQVPTYKKIALRFKTYKKEMYDAWRALSLVQFYAPLIHKSVKSGDFPPLELVRVPVTDKTVLSKAKTFGVLDHISRKAILRTTLMETVARFEYFHSDLCRYVYTDYPRKITRNASDEPEERREKLLNLVFASSSKEEIVNRLVEDRVRSIFYGNPIDLFSEGQRQP